MVRKKLLRLTLMALSVVPAFAQVEQAVIQVDGMHCPL